MLAPSYAIGTLYEGSSQKDRFTRRLNIATMCMGFIALMGVGATTMLTYRASGSASYAGSFLSSNPAANRSVLEDLQEITAVITFVVVITAENLFAGRLLVGIHKSREAQYPKKRRDDELPKLGSRIADLESERCRLGQLLEEINEFPKTSQTWIEATIEQLNLWYKVIREEMANETIKGILERSDEEIIEIKKIIGGKPK